MRRIIAFFIACILLQGATLCAQVSSSEGEGNRVPNSAQQAKVDRVLREKYKTEFASRDSGERGALGKKLREAADAETDPIAKFVYLREARDLAVDAGDFHYSMDVIDDMAHSFAVNAPEMKATALAAGVDRARIPPAELAQRYLQFADQMLAVWDTDLADKAAYLAMKLAGSNRDLMEQARQRDKIAKLRRHEVLQAMAAQQTLARDPDNADANQIIGRHVCFNTNHWDVGLPFLAKSKSPALKEMAAKELAIPTDAEAMYALGNTWWDFNDPNANLPAGATHRRAAFWYAKALAGLSDDKKATAEKRIAETDVQNR